MNLLEKAIQIAVTEHAGQVDKGGHPYILHPLSVMSKVKTIDEKIVAVLHDVIEDTNMTIEALHLSGFGEHILEALVALTKIDGEAYNDFIKRLYSNKLALAVKIADIKENMDLTRIEHPTEEDFKRFLKYKKIIYRIETGYYEQE